MWKLQFSVRRNGVISNGEGQARLNSCSHHKQPPKRRHCNRTGECRVPWQSKISIWQNIIYSNSWHHAGRKSIRSFSVQNGFSFFTPPSSMSFHNVLNNIQAKHCADCVYCFYDQFTSMTQSIIDSFVYNKLSIYVLSQIKQFQLITSPLIPIGFGMKLKATFRNDKL